MKTTKTLTVFIICFVCIVSVIHAENIIITYDYDHIGRLTKADFGSTIKMAYAYDPAGNITSIVETDTTGVKDPDDMIIINETFDSDVGTFPVAGNDPWSISSGRLFFSNPNGTAGQVNILYTNPINNEEYISGSFSASVLTSFEGGDAGYVYGLKACCVDPVSGNIIDDIRIAVTPGYYRIDKNNALGQVLVDSTQSSLATGHNDLLKIEKKENTLFFYINNQQVATHHLDACQYMILGLYSSSNVESSFDDFVVNSLPKRPDAITSHTVLTPNLSELTISYGEYVEVFGSGAADTINVKSGGQVVCRNFLGSNVVNIEDDSSGFTVRRSGAMVSLENTTTGTFVKIPATRTAQTIIFGDAFYELVIESGKVMIGTQIVTLTAAAITGGSAIHKESFTNSLGMVFVHIPAGTFMMGSPEDEPGREWDETQHQVTLTQGYYMQTTEVTQGQWEAVMGSNPSYFSNCGSDCPVESVSWNDVEKFINKLNQRGEGTYVLPTEAQWEYAARAGSKTAFANGEITEPYGIDPNLDAMGWFDSNSSGMTHPVAQKNHNIWGLYDMHGNVLEWCQDWYGDYSSNAVTDPKGPLGGSDRVARGGCWLDEAPVCRSAFRDDISPGYRDGDVGFRLVLSPGQQ